MAALVWVGPSLLATNVAALQLRSHLCLGTALPAAPWAEALVRPDLLFRWRMTGAGVRWPAGAVVPSVGGHVYAAAVAAHAWVPAAAALEALNDRALTWRSRVPAPSSAAGAVLQRAAEVLADREPTRATVLAQRANRALQGQKLLPDPRWLREVDAVDNPVAAAAESLRSTLALGAMQTMANGQFSMWSVPGGVVPGWTAEQADVVASVDSSTGRPVFRMCAAPGSEVLIVNDGFRAELGTAYRITVTLRGTGDTPVVGQVGVRFLDPVTLMTTGAYAWSGPAPASWTAVSAVWTAGQTATSARVVIALAPAATGCIEVAGVDVRR